MCHFKMQKYLKTGLNELNEDLSVRGAVALWLVSFSPYRSVLVQALAKDIAFCPSINEYEELASHPGGSRNTPSRFILEKLG